MYELVVGLLGAMNHKLSTLSHCSHSVKMMNVCGILMSITWWHHMPCYVVVCGFQVSHALDCRVRELIHPFSDISVLIGLSWGKISTMFWKSCHIRWKLARWKFLPLLTSTRSCTRWGYATHNNPGDLYLPFDIKFIYAWRHGQIGLSLEIISTSFFDWHMHFIELHNIIL